MKILALTPQSPYPPMQGTTLRNFYLLRELARRHDLSLLTFLQAGDTLDAESPLHDFCRTIRSVPAPPRRGLARRALSSLASPLPDMALRLPSAAFSAALRAWLSAEQFDIIQVEGIEMAAYGLQARQSRARLAESPLASTPPRAGRDALRRQAESPLTSALRPVHRSSFAPHPREYAGAGRAGREAPCRLVFDDHNAEYVLQRSAFRSDARRPARWHAALYSFVQWQKLARYERGVMRAYDAVAAVSQTDARALQQLAPGLAVHVVPNGVDTEEFAPAPAVAPGLASGAAPVSTEAHPAGADLVFTGKMDYRPNVDAVLWFADEILPRVRAQVPGARFVVVGQQPHARLAPLAARAGVLLTGWVAGVQPYIAGAAVYVAPLRMGGGTRLKVLQAMSMAKPIVSTTLGCDGLSIRHGREALLADTPDEFAAAVVLLLRDPALGQTLGTQARALAVAQYDWRIIGPRMEACYAA